MKLQTLTLHSIAISTFLLTACSGGGSGGSTQSDTSEQITLEESLYTDEQTFYPSQGVYLRFRDELIAQEQYVFNDTYGNEITIIGQEDGSGIFTIPRTFSEDVYKLVIEGEGSISLPIQPIVLTEEPIVMLERSLDDSLDAIYQQALSLEGDEQSQLLDTYDSFENIRSMLYGLNDTDRETVARILFANGLLDIDVASTSSAFNAYNKSSVSISSFNETDCKLAQAEFVASVIGSAAAVTIAVTEPSQIGKVVTSLALVFILKRNAESIATKITEECVGSVVDTILSDLNELRSSSVNNVSALRQVKSPYLKQTTPTATISSAQGLQLFDDQSMSINVEVDVIPSETNQKLLKKLLSALETILTYGPDFISSDVTSLGNSILDLLEPKTEDITSASQINPFNSGDINCNGALGNHLCRFVDKDLLEVSKISFQIKLNHPDYGELQAPATLNPNDVPAVPDQSFEIAIGSQVTNRLEIVYFDNQDLPELERQEVIEFELVKRPNYGVVLNEFNELNVIDYAADITDQIPEEITMEVRARNFYGYSETATITLVFDNPVLDIMDGRTLTVTYDDSDYPRFYAAESSTTITFDSDSMTLTYPGSIPWRYDDVYEDTNDPNHSHLQRHRTNIFWSVNDESEIPDQLDWRTDNVYGSVTCPSGEIIDILGEVRFTTGQTHPLLVTQTDTYTSNYPMWTGYELTSSISGFYVVEGIEEPEFYAIRPYYLDQRGLICDSRPFERFRVSVE